MWLSKGQGVRTAVRAPGATRRLDCDDLERWSGWASRALRCVNGNQLMRCSRGAC